MNRFDFWQRWLLGLSLVIIVFGLGMAVLNSTPLFEPLNHQVDPVFWGSQPIPEAAEAFRGWVYGVMGATMMGWGVFFAFLVKYPLARKEKWAWVCMVSGLLAWYVVDTSISAYFQVYFNVLFNSLLLVAAVLPLFLICKAFNA